MSVLPNEATPISERLKFAAVLNAKYLTYPSQRAFMQALHAATGISAKSINAVNRWRNARAAPLRTVRPLICQFLGHRTWEELIEAPLTPQEARILERIKARLSGEDGEADEAAERHPAYVPMMRNREAFDVAPGPLYAEAPLEARKDFSGLRVEPGEEPGRMRVTLDGAVSLKTEEAVQLVALVARGFRS